MKKKLVERLSEKQRASGDAVEVSEIKLPEGRPQLIVWDGELAGFGVVVGRTQRTFIFNYTAPDGRILGRRCMDMVGHHIINPRPGPRRRVSPQKAHVIVFPHVLYYGHTLPHRCVAAKRCQNRA